MSVSFLIKIPSLHDKCSESGGWRRKGEKRTRIKNGRRVGKGGQEEKRLCVRELLISYQRECLLPFEGESPVIPKEGKR